MSSNSTLIALANQDVTHSKMKVKEFRAAGFDVVFCNDATDVISVFAQPADVRPKMIVMDSYLRHGPEFDGLATNRGIDTGVVLYKRLRTDHPSLPIIIHASVGCTVESLSGVRQIFGRNR